MSNHKKDQIEPTFNLNSIENDLDVMLHVSLTEKPDFKFTLFSFQ
jgi:hypothetical protein